MKQALFFIFLFCSNLLFANLPDSIVIHSYTKIFFPKPFMSDERYSIVKEDEGYIVYQTYLHKHSVRGDTKKENRSIIKKVTLGTIDSLMTALNETSFSKFEFEYLGIDEKLIERKGDSLFQNVKGDYNYWKDYQVAFVKNELSNFENYRHLFDSLYVKQKDEVDTNFTISVYNNGKVTMKINPSHGYWSVPWIINDRESYNPMIGTLIQKCMPDNPSFYNVFNLSVDENLNFLSDRIYDLKCKNKVAQLAVDEYKSEFSQLKPHFSINNIEEYFGHGRYVSMEGRSQPYFKLILHNQKMPSYMDFGYFISQHNNNLYSREPLIADYKTIIKRINKVSFLKKYLQADTARSIIVYYFDNKGINDYLIDSFNKNETEWEKYDNGNINKRFKHLYCGCDLRLDKEYLHGAIMFEVKNEYNGSSIWILLPDGTPVLFHFSGRKVYNYTSDDLKTDGSSVQVACKKFNKKGKIIDK